MDEVGVLVTFIENEGFLRFETLGGIPSNTLPGQRILFRGERVELKGIVGTKRLTYDADEQNKVIPVEDSS